METIQINNYNFHYIEEGSGDPVIFVHGSINDYRTWQNQIEPFAEHFRVIAYSRRYHYPHNSEFDISDYTVTRHSKDLYAFIEALNLSSVHIVGSSYGAYAGLLTAMEHPGRVKTLAMGEPPVIPLLITNMNNPLQILSLLIRDFSTGKNFLKFGMKAYSPAQKQLRKNNFEEGVRLFANGVLGDGGFEKLPEIGREQMIDNGPALKAEVLQPGFPEFPKQDVSKLQTPTLLLYGKKSPTFFHSISDKLYDLLPNGQRVIFSNASHDMHVENWETYNREVMDFLLEHN